MHEKARSCGLGMVVMVVMVVISYCMDTLRRGVFSISTRVTRSDPSSMRLVLYVCPDMAEYA